MFPKVIVLALGLGFALPLQAQTYPEPLGDTVSDFAEVLDPTAEGRISRLLTDTREATGVQMVVVTLSGLGDAGDSPAQIEAYAKGLFNAWGVGGADRNDGILMLIDTEGREARIALGAGYDPVYDGRAARVLSTAVLPALRSGNIAEGVEAGVVSSRERLITPFLAGTPVKVTDGFEDEGSSVSLPGTLIGGAGFLGLAVFLVWRGRRAARTCPRCGALTLERTREIIQKPTRAEAGVGMQHLSCSACGFSDHKSYPVSFSSSEARRDRDYDRNSGGGGGGSSSGGYGGGRSSGGGASGKW